MLSFAFSAALLFAVGLVLRPFALPLLWSSVLTITTWPIFAWLRGRVPSPPWLAAILVTLMLGAILLLVAIPLPFRLADEAVELGRRITELDVTSIMDWAKRVPIVEDILARQISNEQAAKSALASFITAHQSTLLTFATQAIKGILNTLTIIFMSLAGCFILYLHGEKLLTQSESIVAKLGIPRAHHLFAKISATVRGAAYSVIATAIAQGTLAGIGYSVAGAPLPILLALATMILSLIPFGAPILYIPVAGYLTLLADQPWFYGVGLLVWGIICVSTVDNLLRSLLISQATQVSGAIVFVGVVGGVLAFGLIGVFVGPALMAVAQSTWLELAQNSSSPTSDDDPRARTPINLD